MHYGNFATSNGRIFHFYQTMVKYYLTSSFRKIRNSLRATRKHFHPHNYTSALKTDSCIVGKLIGDTNAHTRSPIQIERGSLARNHILISPGNIYNTLYRSPVLLQLEMSSTPGHPLESAVAISTICPRHKPADDGYLPQPTASRCGHPGISLAQAWSCKCSRGKDTRAPFIFSPLNGKAEAEAKELFKNKHGAYGQRGALVPRAVVGDAIPKQTDRRAEIQSFACVLMGTTFTNSAGRRGMPQREK